MKKLAIIGGMVLIGGGLFVGCASKGFVTEEITKSRTQITAEQTKALRDEISKLESDFSKRCTNIETNYALTKAVESNAYDREQKLMKAIDDKIAEVKARLTELSDMKEASIEKFSRNLQASTHIFLKQLREQKEGIERAMEELDKLIAEPTTPATTPPPVEQPK